MMKNHFIVPSGISAAPFGVTHRWATTSRIEYSEDVKIEAIPASPTAERIGAFAGRVSRPRSRNGRTRSAITGMPLSRSPQNAALNSAFSGVPSPNVNCGKMSATLSRPEEGRHGRGEEEHHRGEEEDRDQIPGRLLRKERDAGLVVRALRPVLPRESRPALQDLLFDTLDLHGHLSGAPRPLAARQAPYAGR